MVQFDLQTMIEVIAQAFFSGSIQMAGFTVMLVCLFVFVVVFAAIRAPVQYALIPALIIALFFGAFGIIDPSVSFIIVVVTAVIMASTARGIVLGGR